jgi:hypothetical protein
MTKISGSSESSIPILSEAKISKQSATSSLVQVFKLDWYSGKVRIPKRHRNDLWRSGIWTSRIRHRDLFRGMPGGMVTSHDFSLLLTPCTYDILYYKLRNRIPQNECCQNFRLITLGYRAG